MLFGELGRLLQRGGPAGIPADNQSMDAGDGE
jgi:hypothetical protein